MRKTSSLKHTAKRSFFGWIVPGACPPFVRRVGPNEPVSFIQLELGSSEITENVIINSIFGSNFIKALNLNTESA
jgi:hypothetical protein